MSMALAQKLAADSIAAVAQGQNLQDVLATIRAANPELSAQESGALQDIAYGCQRYLGSLKFMLGKMLNKPIDNLQLESLLLAALYQLHYTRNAPHAVVNEAVESIAKIGRGQYRSFANAILRRFLRERDKLAAACKYDDTAKHNLPQWWVAYLQNHYPKYWHNITAALQSHPPMTLRVNRRHGNAEDYLQKLAAEGIEAKALDEYAVTLAEAVPVSRLPGFSDGLVSVQDFGAQKAAYLLNPQNGERILDACAAPGGKTGHLLELADCHVTALDIDATRLARVQSNIDRLGFHTATLHCADAQDLAAWYDGKQFDAVLADVPCTASGVARRNPDIKWLRRPNDALKTARQQEALLDALWQTLTKNSRMLLATCSIFVEENDQQLQKFLNRHADARLLESHVLLPNKHQDGFYYALIQKQ
ncbi:16S rRNA (cytosine(967)-C(5))-methyltransferase RsmB [Neisseria sp. N95_16]|uniref:16S rRNA (cytosine(967)-C(5))-methyltransferase n=1 Tax=Neisseria brasiliensis TaxID=2666100 RepID=A0A5Q3RZM8_9NEIS|nr:MULTISPECIES: 16S rRNA (cytosine(967)-C(5))-methyltransferase RsmB [Neisseria]MRN38175.1 16S rRNA (cytosine(967)-C(5))-methyltransferase RsmB [Neisseria brasiliensis]PJO09080.1 16S rRNA (cytosine(967)-C(5))-methyltransferase RsmB [Neisseria sp. N95_16]PJO77307.1 16S rRNA (cytosine(967)-C(5))-methyltransferase RsmB [Neisseria sp. N177_16]QGL25175.1 16S rRNA (cytosine(967)-C(5))-methyltransferase RsmB [Neisseria brasiliensis]